MEPNKLFTISLNPSLDRTIKVRYLSEGYTNRVDGVTRIDPAGEGVSISRALHPLGVETEAIVLLGEDPTGRAYEALIQSEAFAYKVFRRSGFTRSDTILVDSGRGHETHLVEDVSELTAENVAEIKAYLQQMLTPGDWVILAGTHPSGWPEETYGSLVRLALACGARVAAAGMGEDLAYILPLKPHLVVLTQNQAEKQFNFPVRRPEEALYCAKQLASQSEGGVMIIMEEEGKALLHAPTGDWQLTLPEGGLGTTSGVWEALLAGYLAGRLEEMPREKALELAAAAAAYTAEQVGSEFGSTDDLESHLDDIDVSRIKQRMVRPG